MSIAKVDSIELYYEEHGSGDPLLLIMGLAADSTAWLFQVPDFAKNYRTIVFDNRGVGRSSKPTGPYAIHQMADDTAGLLDVLGIARTHVVGVSMGGMIAQELVLRHPSKVRSVVLGCTMCGGAYAKLGAPEVLDVLIDVVSNMGKPDPVSWVDRQLPLLFPQAWIDANPMIKDLLVMAVSMMPPTPPATAQNAMAGMFGWSAYERLPEITAPTLIVHGDADVIIPVDNAYILKDRIPGATLHIVPGAGHGYPAQDPVGVHAVVTEFFRRN